MFPFGDSQEANSSVFQSKGGKPQIWMRYSQGKRVRLQNTSGGQIEAICWFCLCFSVLTGVQLAELTKGKQGEVG